MAVVAVAVAQEAVDSKKLALLAVAALPVAAELLALAAELAVVPVVVVHLKQAVLQPEAHQLVVHLLVVAHPVVQVEPAAVAHPKLVALQNNSHQAKNWHNLVLHLAQLCLC